VAYKQDKAGHETVLHNFTAEGEESSSALVRDSKGNLYGVRYIGGFGYGTVFKIDTVGNETVLYNFAGGSDGCHPYQDLIRDKSGNLYGTTPDCGSFSRGTIFKLNSAGTETTLHNFAGGPSDGGQLYFGHLTMDTSGNLYGVTTVGGAHNFGTLYKLSKSGRLTVLHSFNYTQSEGANPSGTVVRDKEGNLYGTANIGGSSYQGTIWEVSKTGKETILHSFAGGTSDGCYKIGVLGTRRAICMASPGAALTANERCGS
jgi:uncharacterized repeat protein (TIGR03803 family)